MNKEYLKLAQETDAWCDQNHAGSDYYNMFWEEKFAELIVKKCADLCRKQSLYYAEIKNMGSASSAADVCRIIIESHFGIKK